MSLWCAWRKQTPLSRAHRTPALMLSQCHRKGDQILKAAYPPLKLAFWAGWEVFPVDFLREQIGQPISSDACSCHVLTVFQARKQTLLQPDPALVTGGLMVSLVAGFCSLGQNLGSLLCFMQLSRALAERFGGWLGAAFTCHKAATNSNCAIIDVVTSKVLRRKKQGSCQATAWK